MNIGVYLVTAFAVFWLTGLMLCMHFIKPKEEFTIESESDFTISLPCKATYDLTPGWHNPPNTFVCNLVIKRKEK